MRSLHPRRKRIRQSWLALVAAASVVSCSDSSGPTCVDPELAIPTGVERVLVGLDGLPFDQFLDDSYEHILRRHPETVTGLGVSASLAMRDDQLDNVSSSYVEATHDLVEGILDQLRGYRRDQLTAGQQVSYDVYEWYLDDWARNRLYRDFDYPITPVITAAHRQLQLFFRDIHPVASRDNARDYIARLRQVARKLAQIRDRLARGEERGIVAPRFLLQAALPQLRSVADTRPRDSMFYTSFATRLTEQSGLPPADRQDLLDQAETAIECHVLPAFRELERSVASLAARAPTRDGVWQFDSGGDFYRHALRHHTTTELGPDEIHQLGMDEIARIRGEMRARFDSLGYPADESLSALFGRVAQDGGMVPDGQVKAEYETIIDRAQGDIHQAFDISPTAQLIVMDSGGGAFYVSGTVDRSRPGVFYADLRGTQPRYTMPTLAYHEAVPGHHFQISLAQEQELATFRLYTTFTAYVEGWALYAERLAADLDWYGDDIYGDLGRLQAEAFRAARLVVDTGIHAKGWSFARAVTYMVDNVGYPRPGMEAEVARYTAWPGQATAYKTGMLRILELRQRASDALGTAFDRKDFHRAVLTSGSLPLDLLDASVQSYIDNQ
ncbi:MAG: DUF885 domain-containing protein [Proteobacteria bacterium]|nr:DUF885 domain-containing protein [Pseudomonadota bacterium]